MLIQLNEWLVENYRSEVNFKTDSENCELLKCQSANTV